MKLAFKSIVAPLIFWVVIISFGYLCNNIFLKQNSFAQWEWEYLFCPILFLAFFILSEKYYRRIVYSFLIIMCISCVISIIGKNDGFGEDGFNQFGLEVIEYSSNLIFLHNESLLQGSLRVFSKITSVKWALCISCMLVIASTTCLLLLLKTINNYVSHWLKH